MECHGTSTDHCCWWAGQPCEFLTEHTNGRRWSCSLRAELGSWDAVHADPRYEPIRQRCLGLSTAPALCGDWPPPGVRCNTCGGVG